MLEMRENFGRGKSKYGACPSVQYVSSIPSHKLQMKLEQKLLANAIECVQNFENKFPFLS